MSDSQLVTLIAALVSAVTSLTVAERITARLCAGLLQQKSRFKSGHLCWCKIREIRTRRSLLCGTFP
jgi:hypothetical protein